MDIAKLAGVSRTTVSLVLNDVSGVQFNPATRKKVLEAASKLGYVPNATAQALASRKTKAIGLVMTRSSHYIASDAFLPKIISRMLSIVKQHNLRVLFEAVETEPLERSYRELAHAKRIDGMLLMTPAWMIKPCRTSRASTSQLF